MVIGIPKEIMHGERRVAATPQTVAKMAGSGAVTLVERSAGLGAFFSDADYAKAGAQIVEDVAELYARAEVILKVKEPQFNAAKGCSEVEMMHAGQVLIAFIHPASPVNHDMVRALAARGVTSLTLDGIPRISRAQSMDALTSMSTCAGYKGMLMAVNDLAVFAPQIFTTAGMIKPAQVLVIGAGVAGCGDGQAPGRGRPRGGHPAGGKGAGPVPRRENRGNRRARGHRDGRGRVCQRPERGVA